MLYQNLKNINKKNLEDKFKARQVAVHKSE